MITRESAKSYRRAMLDSVKTYFVDPRLGNKPVLVADIIIGVCGIRVRPSWSKKEYAVTGDSQLFNEDERLAPKD